MHCTHLVVLDGFGQRLHVDRLVQLVLVQQLDQEVQGALVNAHLGVQHPHLLVHLHAALVQGPGGDAGTVSSPGTAAMQGCAAGGQPPSTPGSTTAGQKSTRLQEGRAWNRSSVEGAPGRNAAASEAEGGTGGRSATLQQQHSVQPNGSLSRAGAAAKGSLRALSQRGPVLGAAPRTPQDGRR